MSTIYIYIYKLASKEIFSPSNKIHREVGRAKDLSALLYCDCQNFRLHQNLIFTGAVITQSGIATGLQT